MSEPLTLAPDTTDETPAVEAGSNLVTLTQAQIEKMLKDAVMAGAAQVQVGGPLGNFTVPPAAPADWSQNELMRRIVARTHFFTEEDERAAYAAVDKHFPAPTDDEE